MNFFKNRPISSQMKPLPAIRHPHASIIDLHKNRPLPSVPKLQFRTKENSTSKDTSISGGDCSNQILKPPESHNYQENETINFAQKNGFLKTLIRMAKLIDFKQDSEIKETIGLQQLSKSTHNAQLVTKSTNSSIYQSKINQRSTKIAIAVYSYKRRDHIELNFKKNDKLVIVDDKQSGWWLAYKFNLPEIRGFIPMNFVKFFDIDEEEWFFSKISRRSAERLLLKPDNPRGTFLIRNSEKDLGGSLLGAYSLSIRDFDDLKLDHVKHYKIQIDSNGDFFITLRKSFVELQDLIEHYSTSENGLCHRLTKACPKNGNYSFFHDDEIDRRELKFIRKLGSGNFGKIFFGIYQGKTKVAIKTLKPGSMSPTAFMQEAAIMRRYSHTNLLQLYGVCSAGLPLLIVTEFMSKGPLLNYLQDNPESATLTVVDLIEMASQIAAGMAYLEEVKLVHKELAARNCFVGDNLLVKVADFGHARFIEDEYSNALVNNKFSIKWTAPEAANFGKFTSKSDVWSYGIVLYELVTKGQQPYPEISNPEVLKHVECGYRISKPTNNCPPSLYQIMLQCWDIDPEKRPTFEYLFRILSEFFDFKELNSLDTKNIPSPTKTIKIP